MNAYILNLMFNSDAIWESAKETPAKFRKKYKIYHDTSKQRVSICSTSQLIEHITKKNFSTLLFQ